MKQFMLFVFLGLFLIGNTNPVIAQGEKKHELSKKEQRQTRELQRIVVMTSASSAGLAMGIAIINGDSTNTVKAYGLLLETHKTFLTIANDHLKIAKWQERRKIRKEKKEMDELIKEGMDLFKNNRKRIRKKNE